MGTSPGVFIDDISSSNPYRTSILWGLGEVGRDVISCGKGEEHIGGEDGGSGEDGGNEYVSCMSRKLRGTGRVVDEIVGS
jgi:hypothetical protein